MGSRHRVRWFFHATAIVRDYELARDALTTLVGLRVLEDTWIDDPLIGRRGGLTWIGDNSLELGQPILENQGVDVYMSRFGPGMQVVAVQVEDLRATLEHLERCHSPVIPGGPGLAFTHPKDTGGVFIEWFTTELPFDPRFGGEIPSYAQPPLLDVRRMAYVGALVKDPPATAERIAELLDTSATFPSHDSGPGAPRACVSLGDNSLALFELPDSTTSQALWGAPYEQPRSHCLAVEVRDLNAAAAQLEANGIDWVRRDEVGIVLRPESTGMVPLIVTDRLLAGDARHPDA